IFRARGTVRKGICERHLKLFMRRGFGTVFNTEKAPADRAREGPVAGRAAPRRSPLGERRTAPRRSGLRPIERGRGRSLAGPHRDDLVWARGGQPLEGRASAGEIHRLVTLAKLAEWRIVKDAAGEAPLFGVDDFDAGLSVRSLESFLEGLPEATVVLTSASDASRFRGLGASVLRMDGGRCAGDGARGAGSVGAAVGV